MFVIAIVVKSCRQSTWILFPVKLQGNHSCHLLLRDILEDLVVGLVELSSEDNIFISQPCRDNTLFLVKLAEEVLVHEQGHLLPVYIIHLIRLNIWWFKYKILFALPHHILTWPSVGIISDDLRIEINDSVLSRVYMSEVIFPLC